MTRCIFQTLPTFSGWAKDPSVRITIWALHTSVHWTPLMKILDMAFECIGTWGVCVSLEQKYMSHRNKFPEVRDQHPHILDTLHRNDSRVFLESWCFENKSLSWQPPQRKQPQTCHPTHTPASCNNDSSIWWAISSPEIERSRRFPNWH